MERERESLMCDYLSIEIGLFFSGELQQPSQSCSIHVTLKIVYSLFKIHAFI